MTKVTHLLRSRRGTVIVLAAACAAIAFITLVGVRTGTPTKQLTGLRATAAGLPCGPERDPSPTQRGYGVPTGFSLDHVVMTDGPAQITKATAVGCGHLQFPFSLGNQADPFYRPDPTKPFAGAGVPANQVAFTPGQISVAGVPLIGGTANISAAPGSTTYAVLHQQTDRNVPGAIDLDMWTTLVGSLDFAVGSTTMMTCNVNPVNVALSNTLPGGQALEGPLNDATGAVAAAPFKITVAGCSTPLDAVPILGQIAGQTVDAVLAGLVGQLTSSPAQLTAHANMTLNLGNPAAIVPPSG